MQIKCFRCHFSSRFCGRMCEKRSEADTERVMGERERVRELMPLQCFELCYVACDIVGSVRFKTNDTLTGHLLFAFLSLALSLCFLLFGFSSSYTQLLAFILAAAFCCSHCFSARDGDMQNTHTNRREARATEWDEIRTIGLGIRHIHAHTPCTYCVLGFFIHSSFFAHSLPLSLYLLFVHCNEQN